jgi:probable F420-dependent oxidoreductase
MEFGISTQSRGLYTTRATYMAVAQTAEQAGFSFLAVNDHIIVPGTLGTAYPYTQGGAWSASEHGHCFDQLATLAFLAGCTNRLRLLTSVMVVPHRPVIQTAKMLSTIDVLSSGRLILGVGAGWMPEEFQLLGAPFAERGAATDEYLEAFHQLWTEDRPSYKGRHVNFDDLIFAPKPLQPGGPPIWVGGESPAALRRTVKLGSGWYPGNNNQKMLMDTPERLKAGIAKLHAVAEKAGRDPASIPAAWRRYRDGIARAHAALRRGGGLGGALTADFSGLAAAAGSAKTDDEPSAPFSGLPLDSS